MQVLEYDRSFLAARIMMDKFNGSIIISGAFGLFQKNMVVAAGGYETNTVARTWSWWSSCMCSAGRTGIPTAFGTPPTPSAGQVPERLRDLRGQRRRWHIGLFQSMTRHRKILANPKYGMVSFVSYLYFLIYELLSPYIEVFGVCTMVLASLLDFLNVPFMLLYLGIYIVYSAILSLAAFFAGSIRMI